MRRISDLFKHKGHIYIYCCSRPVWNMFVHDLAEQGFEFNADAVIDDPNFNDIIAVNRDFTACYCGYASHVRFGSLKNPVYVKEDSSQNCTRVDYARFISGEKKYVIRGSEGLPSFKKCQKLPAGTYYIWI